MLKEQELLRIIKEKLAIDVDSSASSTAGITVGVVVDTDDPLQCGRLRVFCPNLNDDPKKLQHLPWASYVSPYGGTISNSQFSRGSGKGPEKSDGATSYGFWAIPEQGATVLVTCIDGDERRRVWLGCLYAPRETHTLFHGRYEWQDGGSVDGPLTSSKSPIEPLHTNASKAFDNKKDSPEWKTRQAEYQATANTDHENPDLIDQQNPEISELEQHEWVKPILGSHGYDWTRNKALGEFLASMVSGFSTPGLHAFTLDDRPFNNRIRLRSSTGHQIILDDTNERIYVSTNEGNSWIEMDSNGNIDVYAARRLSAHAQEDINLSTEGSIRLKGKKGIFMYAGDTEGQTPLEDGKPEDGEIRLHSTSDTHIVSEKSIRTLTYEDKIDEIAGKLCQSVGDRMYLQVESGIDTIVNDGDYNISVNGSFNLNASEDVSLFAGNDSTIQSKNDTTVFSYSGKMDIGSQLDMVLRSYKGNIGLESIENDINFISNQEANQIMMTEEKISVAAKDKLYLQAGDDIYFKIGVDGNSVEKSTTIDEIEESFSQIETNVNDFMNVTHQALDTMISSWGGSLGSITLPTPNFPTPPSLLLTPVEIVRASSSLFTLANIDDFNPIPDSLFYLINSDFAGWTISSVSDWFSQSTSLLSGGLGTIGLLSALGNPQINSAIGLLQNAATVIATALTQLVDPNLLNNATYINDYTSGISSMIAASTSLNQSVATYNQTNGTSFEDLSALTNSLVDHNRSISDINTFIQSDTASVQGADFSGLQDVSDFMTDFDTQLSQIGGP